MITIKNCNEVSIEDIYSGFKYGYVDYPVPMTLPIDAFMSRFFGTEGNQLEDSFIAYDEEKPVGMIFGGIRKFDNVSTMRCGTLCVGPEYRGQKISNQLMDMHIEKAKEKGCKQLFLEVIKTNARAVNFYKKCGYYQVYDLKYYTFKAEKLVNHHSSCCTTERVSLYEAAEFRNRLADIHINWQNETDYFSGNKEHVAFIARTGASEIGYIVMSKAGKIEQLYVYPDYRRKGIAASLVSSAANEQKAEKISACISCSSQYEGFLRKCGFDKEDIEQFEMYKLL